VPTHTKKLVANLEKTYPDYYQLKYNVKTVSVTAIQQHLQKCPHKTVIEYLVGKELIYVFSIGVNHYQLHTLPKPVDLDEQIAEFSEALNALNYEEYVTFGYQLYQTLLQPILQSLPQSTEPHAAAAPQLVIIPDQTLYYLPFEALLTYLPDNTP
jgi:CHAT domain-containing protein